MNWGVHPPRQFQPWSCLCLTVFHIRRLKSSKDAWCTARTADDELPLMNLCWCEPVLVDTRLPDISTPSPPRPARLTWQLKRGSEWVFSVKQRRSVGRTYKSVADFTPPLTSARWDVIDPNICHQVCDTMETRRMVRREGHMMSWSADRSTSPNCYVSLLFISRSMIAFQAVQLYFDSSISHLQTALQLISSWMSANLLTLNSSKTEFLIIGLKQQTF